MRNGFFYGLCSLLTGVIASRQLAYAQVIPDDTLGSEQSVLVPAGSGNFLQQIQGGARREANLFHSFRDFDIASEQSIYFLSPAGVENIITRVTGDDVSSLEGTLGTIGTQSNLFLLNPNGIIFGENARLDVQGSFIATTAPTLQFGEQGVFSSSSPEMPPLLTVSPSAFLFEEFSSASLINQSTALLPSGQRGLQVPSGESLLLLGGEINLAGGGLVAAGGRVEIGAVAGVGGVGISQDESDRLQMEFLPLLDRSDVSLTSGATIDTSGERSGPIRLLGRQILMTDGAQILAFTQGESAGDSVTLDASDSISIVGLLPGAISAISFGGGSAGAINIKTQRLQVLDGAQIISATLGNSPAGQPAGQINIEAADTVEIAGQGNAPDDIFSGFFSVTEGEGQAGNIFINTRRLILRDRGVLTTESTPVFSPEEEQFFVPPGAGGNLSIVASEAIEIRGESLVTTATQGSSDAGNLILTTGELSVQDRSQISTETFGSGDAGNIEIQARSVLLGDRAQIEAITTTSEGGDITMQVSDFVVLRRDSRISTEAGTAEAGGNGGDITLDVPDGFVIALPDENSDINANAFEGDGGNISITARNLLGITFRPDVLGTPQSDITASSRFGNSGSVTINELNPNSPQTDAVLPADTAAPPLAAGCRTPGTQTSHFVSTGRGGLPANPTSPISSRSLWQDMSPLMSVGEDENAGLLRSLSRSSHAASTQNNLDNSSDRIIEAQSWALSAQGTVVLSAQSATEIEALHAGSCLSRKAE